MLKVEVFGKSYCPYCRRAQAILEFLKGKNQAEGTYTDMDEANITKEMLGERAGKEVRTIPQVWVDGTHIGGCDDFVAFLTSKGYEVI